MKKIILIPLLLLVLLGCRNNRQSNHPEMTAAPQIIQSPPAEHQSTWSVYDTDPNHLWNRVFRQLYRRTTLDGTEYGSEELDPLLWFDTTYLLNGSSHLQAVEVLDEFLSTHAEDLIRSPLKRAMFQRDLWAVFDWLAFQAEPYPSERQALETRLAQLIKRVALSKEEIESLPNNYTLEVKANTLPADVPPDQPEMAFLPADIFQAGSAWVPMGREGGPLAMTHTEAFPFFGRSVFLVFVRSPNGRAATLNFIEALKTEPHPVTAIGSDVALVRRMLLVDMEGNLMLSPLVETIQVRHFAPAQSFHEFELNRARLFYGFAGGLGLKTDLFMLFMSHGDVFDNPDISDLRATIPEICAACHFEYPPIPNSGNTQSIISFSRQPFSLPDNSRPILFPTTIKDEAQTVIEWKMNHETWQSLTTLWNQTSP
jgi:hypothetical protein